MKTKYIGAVAALALFGLAEQSSAQFSSGWSPQHKNPDVIVPGEMKVQGGFGFSTTGELILRYNFAFLLAVDSDGIYPAAEMVEIEVPGELSPDGHESAAFVISIPIGSFQEAPTGFFLTWNPPGLTVSQHYESNVWEFVDSGGVRRDANGVRAFWAFIRQREAGEVVNLDIKLIITDTRSDGGTTETAPRFLELVFGGPTLNIGNDKWETRPYTLGNFVAGPLPPN